MAGAPVSRLTVSGVAFTVRHDGQRAESVRTSLLPNADLRVMLALSKTAIERASGCPIRPGTLYGDRVMAEAFLACEGRAPARLQPRLVFTPAR